MKLFLALIPLFLVSITENPSSAGEMHMPPYEGSPGLKEMKALAVTWTGTHIME